MGETIKKVSKDKTIKSKKKTTTEKKTIKKKANKKKITKKKSKAFTLIELLAVIIILGILMIIAIPSVTTYINDTRKDAYIDTAKAAVNSTRNIINSGKLPVYDTETTYYIPLECIQAENDFKSPFGEFDVAYVAVIYTGNGFNYYWVSRDVAGIGVPKLIKSDDLDVDDLITNLKPNSVKTNIGVGNRENIIVLDKNSCTTNNVVPIIAAETINTDSNSNDGFKKFELPAGKTVNSKGYVDLGIQTKTYYYENNTRKGKYYGQVYFLNIPEGATEYLMYYTNRYSNSSDYISDSDIWTPVTIERAKYVCSTSSSCVFNGTEKYISVDYRAANPNFYRNVEYRNESFGVNIFKHSDGFYYFNTFNTFKSNGRLSTIITGDDSHDLYFKIKFRGDGYKDSEWYFTGFDFKGIVDVRPCFTADMEVDVYDKKKKKRRKKKIKDLNYNDLILVWDFDKGELSYAEPLWIKVIETAQSYYLLKFSDGSSLKIVHNHRIFNADKGMFTQAVGEDTPIGTTTLNSKGELVKLESCEEIEETVEYCNVITKHHINLFVNGILTSWRINNLYEIKNLKFVKNNRVLNKREKFPEIDDEWFDGLRIAESIDSKDKILDDIKYCKEIQSKKI